MTKPISPDEVSQEIPDVIIRCFNEMIQAKYVESNKTAMFKKDEIVAHITANTTFTSSQLYEKHYLDVEPLYKKAGWTVTYDQPAYNESYKAYFKFTKPKA